MVVNFTVRLIEATSTLIMLFVMCAVLGEYLPKQKIYYEHGIRIRNVFLRGTLVGDLTVLT
jgi:hypothetical protein